MNAGLKTKDIAQTIHAHPTLSEALMETAEDLHGEAIHVPKK
jgi:dihydrolipoamide dehydrogenase